jgi:chemotaxis response regulator CheB
MGPYEKSPAPSVSIRLLEGYLAGAAKQHYADRVGGILSGGGPDGLAGMLNRVTAKGEISGGNITLVFTVKGD